MKSVGRVNSMGALLAIAITLGLGGAARAETIPARGKVDGRIRTATYNADEVYKLYGFVGYAIELIFEEGESFVGKGGGDLEGVTIDAHANSVLLKPKALVVSTNLVVYTDRRAYRFDYSVAERRTTHSSDDVIYALRFLYAPTAGKSTPESRVASELARAKTTPGRNIDYWFCGNHALKPAATSDDGVHTRITFTDRAEIPAIFVRNEDGTESLLNFSMEEGDVVIHRLAPRFILRRGRVTACIVNKGYLGAGSRLESGTVSPNVERERKEAKP
jgi:type IV secretion system protein VirB9